MSFFVLFYHILFKLTISECHFQKGVYLCIKIKSSTGFNNICGQKIKELRLQLPEKTSQRKFADMLQIHGLDVDKNAIQRIESGQRFVTDIELKAIASVLNVSCDTLLNSNFS